MASISLQEQKRSAVKVTLIGAGLDLLLGILKVVVGLLFNSFALVSDGVHSFSDLLTDALVLVVSRHSREGPDLEHPYGHGRFETVGTIAIGTFLFSVAGIIIYDSIRRLLIDNSLYEAPGWLALVVALISIASKEWIYRYTKKIALDIDSSLLLANAWHSRTDALSSIAVLVGVLGAMWGFPSADILAALFVAIMIGRIAWQLVTESIKELVDTALPAKELALILDHIQQLPGIVDAHNLRSRLHGGKVLLEIHVQVDKMISVSEGHFIADRTSEAIMERFSKVSDIVVHIDPELDTLPSAQQSSLPFREQARKEILQCFQDQLADDKIRKINLHYINEQIITEIFIEKSILNSELEDYLKNSVRNLKWLKELRFYE